MGKFILAMITLAMCVPVYAGTAVLVYTVSHEAIPWQMGVDTLNMTVADTKPNFKIQGALIFDVNVNTLETVMPDESQAPVFIVLSKDVDGTQLNYTLTGSAANVNFVKKYNVRTKQTFVVGNWYFDDPNWFCSTLGTVGPVGSGLTTITTKSGLVTVSAPLLLKGIGTICKNPNGPFDIVGGVGDGPVIATLNQSITKQVNENGNGTVSDAVALVARKLPPTPNPLTWVVAPRQIVIGSGYYHTMKCCDVFDQNPPILYRFVCLDNSGISSGWQDSTSYQAPVGSTHFYRWYVIAKDGYGNTTGKGNAVWVQQ